MPNSQMAVVVASGYPQSKAWFYHAFDLFPSRTRLLSTLCANHALHSGIWHPRLIDMITLNIDVPRESERERERTWMFEFATPATPGASSY